MNPQHLETLTKAAQCADLLTGDIRQAHHYAAQDDPVLAMVLLDLIGDAAKLKNRLGPPERKFP